MSEMPLIKFIIYTLGGSLIWNTVLVCIGAFAGDKRDYILNIIDNASNVILLLIIFGIIIFIYRFYKKKKTNF
jgi:membrane protein DedA with SNARE-associated domain